MPRHVTASLACSNGKTCSIEPPKQARNSPRPSRPPSDSRPALLSGGDRFATDDKTIDPLILLKVAQRYAELGDVFATESKDLRLVSHHGIPLRSLVRPASGYPQR